MAAARLAACCLACALATAAQANTGDDRDQLRRRHEALAAALAASAFGEPLVVQSTEARDGARGDVYAVLPQSFRLVDSALARPAQWCEVLILHLNVKGCHWSANSVSIHLGGKRSSSIDDAYPLTLHFQAEADSVDYLRVRLDAPKGPMGTRNYLLLFEAVPLSPGETFVHFDYQVSTGLLARLAMRGYLLTTGRGKIGFSTEAGPHGAPQPVAGTRGVVERNAMRYHLAIAAYLDSLGLPEGERVDARLKAWFDGTERFAAQLHEVDRDDYLSMKRVELRN